MKLSLALVIALSATPAFAQCGDCDPGSWTESFIPGGKDPDGNALNATEVRQFVPYGGALYVATGAWMDQGSPKGSAKILRLDGPDQPWRMEVDFGGNGTTTGGLASLHFDQTKGNAPVDVAVLVAATWSGANAYARNEADHKWYKHAFGEGQIRAFGVHHDTVANETFAFAGGKPGAYRGQLEDQRPAGKNPIEWMGLELNTVQLDSAKLCSGGGRVTGFAEANGKLFLATCWRVYERVDGPVGDCRGPTEVKVGTACQPRWKRFWDDPLSGSGESGLRGLTTVKHEGQDALLVGSEVANAHITRIDPETAASVVEFNVDQFLDTLWGVNSGYKIVGYNSPMPLWFGPDGIGRRVIGFESWLPGAPKPGLARKLVNIDDGSPQQMLGEGMFFVRDGAGNYILQQIPAITDQPMTAVRDCAPSPFPAECNAKGQDCILYCGGFDANKSTTQTPCLAAPCTFPPLVAKPTRNTAWVVKGRIELPAAASASVDPNEGAVPHIGPDEEPALPFPDKGEP